MRKAFDPSDQPAGNHLDAALPSFELELMTLKRSTPGTQRVAQISLSRRVILALSDLPTALVKPGPFPA